jgi:heme-degrading monooxygenase HmoA
MSIYTLGIRTVRPGTEDEFVEAWTDMAARTAAEFPAPAATLLRDRAQPNRFISFGPWSSMEDIERWRGSGTFQNGVARIRTLLEDFQPHTLDEVASVGSD